MFNDGEIGELLGLLKRNQSGWTMSVIMKLVKEANKQNHWPMVNSFGDTFVGQQDLLEQLGQVSEDSHRRVATS